MVPPNGSAKCRTGCSQRMDAFVKRLPQAEKDDAGSLSHEPASERPRKRLRGQEVADSASERSDESSSGDEPTRGNGHDASTGDDELPRRSDRTTDVENVLPPTETDDGAIEKYELMKSSQKSSDGDETTAKGRPLWIKGKSSIYVDAFGLALDTVLEEESQLFDEKEMEVFRQWRGLNYEAQYLYVRLFLRKTAAWHRSSRLGYYADVPDAGAAIASLQSARSLPQPSAPDTKNPIPGLDLDEFVLGETFTFADASEEHITTVDEAASLLYLDELKALAKEAKVQGRNKAELIKGLSRMSRQQAGLMALGLGRRNGRDSNTSADSGALKSSGRGKVRREEDSNREQHFLNKIFAILGPCIRLSPLTFKLFERVHLVFYRSTEWTEKSLTTIILAKIARRNFPEYIVCRTSTIFASRTHLLEFEAALRLEAEVDGIMELSGTPSEDDMQRIVDMFDKVYPRWQEFVTEEQDKERRVYEMGEGAYLRRFNPAHSYTRVVLKAMFVFGRRKEYLKEYDLLSELLDQKLFHLARRGAWYQRKALLEEHYMPKLDEHAASTGREQQKKHWKRIAASTCEAGLQDANCHLIYHYDLQKRLVKLEKKLRIPRRLQHDFGHVRLAEPIEITVEGVQLKREVAPKRGAQAASTKTIWLDELGLDGECSVEEMCLSRFRSEGWKGYHAEGGVVRTLFAYLFYDILFLYVPNVFQTAYQTCPLDLHTDAFFPARASEINHRLVEIANGAGERLLREVWAREHERRTSAVGLNWDFDVEDLAELVRCFEGSALAAICKVMAQEYKHRGGGVPDLLLWRTGDGPGSSGGSGGDGSGGPGAPRGEVMFAEVKSANDRLSDTQRLWIHVLTGAGVKVALCNAVAREVREVD
ncbi:Fanconi-associated nuclease 1-like protein [Tolypocladium capitatum]|uniref:Fanconi-associated nuclease n=1 Tax=Tolypocladium capitatum TaxID=45235 RepID=A0A2K3QE02_9HYPO|nr:Fanconi-associated nuclease 1-like protein [Tolypocladium capitatum]